MSEERFLDIPVAPAFERLCAPSRYKAIYGGRGKGGSHFFADQVIAYSMSEKMDIICLREVQLSLSQSIKKLIENKIEQHGLGKRFKILDSHIESDLGGRIGFQGMQNHTADSIKSLEGYRIALVEEAASLSQRSLDLLRPTIRWEDKARGLISEMWFVWNPNKCTDPVDHFFRGNNRLETDAPFKLRDDAVAIEASYDDNPWFPSVLRKDMEEDRNRDPDKYAHVWLGQYWHRSDARVFKNVVVEEFERPPGTVFRHGADWGFSVDPSVLVRMSIEGKRLYIDYEAYMVGCPIDQLPDLFDRIPHARDWFITADSARPETIDYMRTHGYPKVNAARKGKGSIEEGISFLQSFEIVIHPRCTNCIREFFSYSYRIDQKTDEVIPVLDDKRNHTIDSARYSLEGLRRAEKSGERKNISDTLVTSLSMGGSWMGG